MSRPYFKKRIAELEAIFAGAGEDRKVLRALRDELEHRKTRRALALRKRVAAALEVVGAPSATADETAPPVPSGAPVKPSREGQAGPSGPVVRVPPERRRAVSADDHGNERPDGSGTTDGSRAPADDRLPDPMAPEFAPGASERRPSDAGDRPTPAPDADALLAAWTTLEILEPQPMPKPRDLEAIGRRMVRCEEHPEPWTEPRYGPRGRQRGVYWFVHLGELDLMEATESLLELFPDRSPEKVRPVRGTAPLAVVVLDGKGRPAEGKVFLSSFAWGYGRVRSGGLGSLAEFPTEEHRLCQDLGRRVTRMDEEGELLPVTPGDLERVTRWIIDQLGLPSEQISEEPVCVRVPVWGRVYEAPEPELLNSFFLEDLARVRSAWAAGDRGAAQAAFLSGLPRRSRVDVVRRREVLDETLAPDRIPRARWPVRGRFPLVTMQQAAVDHAVRELCDIGLVGVNGPPGTGKTTLLRDVVAAVVLERAEAMAELDDPREAFTHVAPMSAGRGFLHLYGLDERLLGHEIVVASSNNKAVENISREIPAVDAVADDFEPSLRYFAHVADRVLQEDRNQPEEGIAWGLAAAVLGNAANRHRFTQAFWWDRERGLRPYLYGIADGWSPEVAEEARGADEQEGTERGPAEILLLEDAPRDRPEALQRWREARARFRAALERAGEERGRLESFRRALGESAAVRTALEAAREEVGRLRSAAAEAARAAESAEKELGRARERKREAVAERDAVKSLRPGFFARLFRTARHREWRGTMARAVEEAREARAAEHSAEAAWRETTARQAEVSDLLQRTEKEVDRLEERQAHIQSLLAAARDELGERLPDRRFWSLPEEERQLLSPWLSERFQAARDDLFAACFDLHRAFVGAAAPRLRHNLGAAMMLLRGRKLTEAQEPARRSLWASLFLVVPVISTTFASVSRMFGPLGREELGWLLIDEAGQAVPQAAVGAIWRARRVIAIGDPMQVPPVVAMPQRLIDSVMTEHGVDPDAWAAPRASVQALADRASWFGTELLTEQGDVWVGSPLRVHRRCEQPMFRISNRVAYNGLMVQATPPASSPIGEVLGESAWFQVEGSRPGHWCPEEGELAARLLERVFAAGIDEPEIFFITPFRAVQDNLRNRLRRVVEERSSLPARPWSRENVGTIHTFQGKEAEAVVLVLGAPSSEAVGARRWAGGSPNLLNVAVSRAKRRLYVIGDRRSWRSAGVFRTLAEELPVREPG